MPTVVIAFDPDPAQHGTLREVTDVQAKVMIREGRARLATDADHAASAAAAEAAEAEGAQTGEPAASGENPRPATRAGRRATPPTTAADQPAEGSADQGA